MNWTVKPLVGVGALEFGMLLEQVGEILDPIHEVTSRDEVFDGSVSEHRGIAVPACSYDGNVLRGIDTNKYVNNVIFEGLDVYNEMPKDVMLHLFKRNGGAEFGLGLLLFESLSIASNGFFSEDEGFFIKQTSSRQDDRTLSVYKKGSFDNVRSHLHQIDLGKY